MPESSKIRVMRSGRSGGRIGAGTSVQAVGGIKQGRLGQLDPPPAEQKDGRAPRAASVAHGQPDDSRHIPASAPKVTGPLTLGAGAQRREARDVTGEEAADRTASTQRMLEEGGDDPDAGRPAADR